MAFSVTSFNDDFYFDLPEGLWESANFLDLATASEIYGVTDYTTGSIGNTIPIIGFGVNKIDRVKHPNAVSDKSGWIATETELINVPQFQIPKIEALLKNVEAVNACRQGHIGAVITTYTNDYGKQFKVTWVDR